MSASDWETRGNIAMAFGFAWAFPAPEWVGLIALAMALIFLGIAFHKEKQAAKTEGKPE